MSRGARGRSKSGSERRFVHSFPARDIKPHVVTRRSADCWCEPEIEWHPENIPLAKRFALVIHQRILDKTAPLLHTII